MRLVFFGTPEFAVASLGRIVDAGHEVCAVVTAPDRPAGRGQKLQPSAVKSYALSKGIDILQPSNLKDPDFVDELRRLEAQIHVVVAFRMLPEMVWNMPPEGTYNVHASLLPDYRGAAPIHWAVINGETETGVTTFKLQHKIDTGSILLQRSTLIGPNETTGTLYNRLMEMGADLIVASLTMIEKGDYELKAQAEGSQKHAPKLTKEHGRIDWKKSANEIHNLVRGMFPFPGAYTTVGGPEGEMTWKIHSVAITNKKAKSPGTLHKEGDRLFVDSKDFQVEIITLQPPGKKPLPASSFLNGYREPIDELSMK